MSRFIGEQIIPMHLKGEPELKSRQEELELLQRNTVALLQGTKRMMESECNWDWVFGARRVELCAERVGAYELLDLLKSAYKPEKMSQSEREDVLTKIRREATEVVQCLHERFEQAERYDLFRAEI